MRWAALRATRLRHLGALGCLLFAWLVGSGVFLFAVLDTSASGAWQSIESLSHGAWGLGSVPRSMHRYAADAFVWVVFAHLLRRTGVRPLQRLPARSRG